MASAVRNPSDSRRVRSYLSDRYAAIVFPCGAGSPTAFENDRRRGRASSVVFKSGLPPPVSVFSMGAYRQVNAV